MLITTSSCRMPKILRSLALLTCMALTVAFCCAQIGRVPTPARRGATPYSSISSEQTPSAKESAPSHAQAALTTVPGVVATYQNCDLKTRKAGFGKVGLGLVATQECDVQVAAGNPIVSIDISDSNGADPSPVFKNVTTKTKGDPCNPTDPLENNKGGTCEVGVGFMPADDHSTVTATLTVTFWDRTSIPITLSGSGGSAAGCSATANIFLPLHQGFEPGKIYPFAPKGMSPDLAIALYKAFGDPMRKSVVNCFYSTNNLFSYFNQFQSIYNAASGSTTVSATIGTLNFASGAQLTVETRPQIGTPTSSGTVSLYASVWSTPTFLHRCGARRSEHTKWRHCSCLRSISAHFPPGKSAVQPLGGCTRRRGPAKVQQHQHHFHQSLDAHVCRATELLAIQLVQQRDEFQRPRRPNLSGRKLRVQPDESHVFGAKRLRRKSEYSNRAGQRGNLVQRKCQARGFPRIRAVAKVYR